MLLSLNVDEDTKVNGRKSTLRQMLKTKISENERTTRDIDQLIDRIKLEYPTMQVSVPELEGTSAEDWDIENHTPLVAVLESGFGDKDTGQIIAYNLEGNEVLLSVTEEPEQLVIVVGPSERIVAVDKGEGDSNARCDAIQPIDSDDDFDYYLYDDYRILDDCGSGGGGTGGGATGGGSGGGAVECDRDRKNSTDKLGKAKFKDIGTLKQVEPWAWGAPEVRLYIVRTNYNNNNPVSVTFPYPLGKEDWTKTNWRGKRSVIWKDLKTETFIWDKELHADMSWFLFVEEDDPLFEGSADVSINGGVQFLGKNVITTNFTVSTSVSIGGQDDVIYLREVFYCDNTDGDGQLYAGTMRFYVKQ